jgi:putative transposase
VSYYERNLPHWQPEGAALFVTWRLHGYLPTVLTREVLTLPPGKAFGVIDRELDEAKTGPHWLGDARVAQMVADSMRYGEQDLKIYELRAWVIMPNHVHVVLYPRVALDRITRSTKSFTGRKANELLGIAGRQFWQQESYDHWVRDGDEMERIVRYVERNPVKAGLAAAPEGWRWSSAAR